MDPQIQCPFGSSFFTNLILFHQMKIIHLRIVRNSLVFFSILDCTVVKSVFIACINIPQDLDDRQSFKIDIIELSL